MPTVSAQKAAGLRRRRVSIGGEASAITSYRLLADVSHHFIVQVTLSIGQENYDRHADDKLFSANRMIEMSTDRSVLQ